ncbi:MAG: hypothetical protein JWM56_761 [Candidatus Peribacteria bacterium]|nr:hypothetical protein [Candidatus Peribacteria bacterium]
MINWSEKRVLITGGTGFIGSFLVEALVQKGARVRVPVHTSGYGHLSADIPGVEWFKGDLQDIDFCRKLVADTEYVFHLAAVQKNIAYHHEHAGAVLMSNLSLSVSLIQALAGRSPVPVVFFSSSLVKESLAVSGENSVEPVDGYTLSKAISEILWGASARESQFSLLIIRPAGVYGPREKFGSDAHVIPSLMERAATAPDVLEVWGDGCQERAFVYVTDVVDAVLILAELGAEGVQYIGPSASVPVRVLAETIRDVVRPGLPLHFDISKPSSSSYIPPLSVHSSLIAFPWTSLENGIRMMHDWYLSHLPS